MTDATYFDGATYNAVHDQARLATLLNGVKSLMSDGQWRTLGEIHALLGYHGSEASISARLRDLRKRRFGAYTVNHRTRGAPKAGLWEYQLVPPGLDAVECQITPVYVTYAGHTWAVPKVIPVPSEAQRLLDSVLRGILRKALGAGGILTPAEVQFIWQQCAERPGDAVLVLEQV